MKATLKRNPRIVIICGVCLILVGLFVSFVLSESPARISEKTVKDSWNLMREVGQYDFSTTVEQITYPAPALANVGQSSTREVYQIGGKADLTNETFNIMLYQNRDSLLNQKDGVEIKIEQGKAVGRAIGTENWQPLENYNASSFAVGNNGSPYLASAKNILAEGSKTLSIPQADGSVQTVQVRGFRFDVDSNLYAAYVRDQMVQELQQSGKLPVGMNLSVSDQYRRMVASGELWVSQDGLPVRLAVTMKMPPEKTGGHVEAVITTDYFNHNTDNLLAFQPLPVRLAGLLGFPTTLKGFGELASGLGITAGCALLLVLMLVFSKKKMVYGGAAFLVIASMLISPLWQSEKSAAFAKDIREQNTSIEADQQAARAEREAAQKSIGSTWDAHTNPMDRIKAGVQSGNAVTSDPAPSSPLLFSSRLSTGLNARLYETSGENDVDTDQDGLTDAYESESDITVLNPNKADTDDDGLNDYVELLLNLFPGEADTDGDGILDIDEVRSFYYADKDWYLNAEERDTDLDGQIDGAECSARTNGGSDGICRDTDGDLVPDVFDSDDDNDGIPTVFDESPYVVSDLYYSPNNPFELTVTNLEAQPVYINYQVIPTNPKHLTYALNVLDWPSNDTDGQIQRITAHTYADKLTANQISMDPRSQFGDMRLIPMLEIKLTGDSYPLPLSRTAVVNISSDQYTAGFEFSSQEALPGKTSIKLTSGADASKTLHIGRGTCDEYTDVVGLNLSQVNDVASVDLSLGALVGGDYVLYLKNSSDGSFVSCSPIPVLAHGKLSEYVIDQAAVQAYGGAVRNDDDGNLLVYMPLSVVYDETGGDPVAFSAKVPYTNILNGFENSAQELRMIWMVNMLTDQCKPIPADYDETASGTWCNSTIPERWDTDISRVIHTYTDEYRLAGLSVVEDHGVDMAVVFENPATDTEPDYDDPLWGMAHGLEHSFLAARSADGVNLDITVAELQQRFDPDYNAGVTDMNKLWGFEKDTFRVSTYSYDNYDGVSAFVRGQVNDLFADYFNTIPEENRPLSTSLLFARQFSQRALSMGEAAAACTSNSCAVDFAGQDIYTQAMINWAPYQRSGDTWQSYDLNDYLDNLEAHLRNLQDYQPEDETADAKDLVNGKIELAKIYYRNLYSGIVMLVAVNGSPMINAPVVISDEDVLSTFNVNNTKGKVVATVITTILTTMVEGLAKNPKLILAIILGTKADAVKGMFMALGKGFANKVSPITDLLTTRLRKAALGVGIVVAVVGLAVLAILYLNGTNSPAGKWAGRILYAVVGTVSAVLAGAALYSAIKAVKAVADTAKAGAIIGIIIGSLITWGVFFYTWGASGVSIGSIAFNNMLADAIAATATIVLFAALSATGVGAIVVAIIGLIDGIIMGICALAGAYEQEEDHWARQYVCIGISGWVTKIFKWVLYSNTYLIDYDNAERLSFNKVDQDLQHIAAGMTTGNNMQIAVAVTNTISKSSVPLDWKAAAYFWQYSDSNAKTSTFAYAIQTAENDIHDDLSRGDMSSQWESLGGSKWKHDFTASSGGYTIPVPNAGINQDPTVYLSEGSALPVQECWAIYYPVITPVPIPVCYIRTEKATINSEISESLTVDVFPTNLDGFYTLTMDERRTAGAKLAWGQSGNTKFPVQRDADGDGLLSRAFADGNDPDDTLYDTDEDGLNDFYEIANGTNPRMVDSDDDGLNDNLEIQRMTDPNRKDTDGDGLTDFEEVLGWLYTYDFTDTGAPLETMVYPNPLMADSDLDGVTDYLEKVYGFNPQVPQNADVLSYELAVREQDSPIIMLRLNESSGAMVFDDSSNFGFAASCTADECPISGVNGRYAAAVHLDGSDLLHLPTTAKAISLTGSQPFTIGAWVNTSSGGTVLAKWSDAADGQQELRFEITSSGNLQLISSTATAVSTGAIPADTWTHVTAAFNGSQVSFYINGALSSTSSFSNTPVFGGGSVPAEFTVGAYESGAGPTGTYSGMVDELAFFDHALSGEDIATRLMTARYNFNDSFVRPGEELVYKSTITNLLNSRFAYGLLTTLIDKTAAIVDWASKLLPTTFVLYPDNPVVTGVNTTEIETRLQIEPGYTTSEDVTISQTASAQIVDRRAESNLAELWLKLDEVSGATTFVDDSGTMPPRESACSICPTSGETGILNKSVQFGSGQNSAINLPDLSTLNLLNRGFTISMWVKPVSTATAGVRIPLLKSDSNRLSINLVRQPLGDFLPEVLVNNTNMVGSTWRYVQASVWSHLVVAYSSADSKVRVYINGGQIADTAATVLTSNANLWLGGATAPTDFYVDDLRIFSRALTVTDINRLAERPVFEMNMDGGGFTDSSVYNQTISTPKNWPLLSHESVRGMSLNPSSGPSTGYVQVSGNTLLNMSDGSFTYSVWLFPTSQSNSTWQGVFGYRENDATAYPSLERQGLKLRFGYGDGSTFQSHTTADILTQYKWNQVVITYGPSLLEPGKYMLKLYVDSVLKESKSFTTKPYSTSSFYVGTTSRSFTTSIYRLTMSDEHDAGSHAEVYVREYVNGSHSYTPMGETSMADGDTHDINYSKKLSNYEYIKFTVWEADSTSADDNCGSFTRNWFDLPDGSTQTLGLSDGFDGSLTFQMTRTSIPFSGYIDDLRVYRYALDSEQAYDLYYAVPVTARLQLDDRPSSTYFENKAVIGVQDDGTCTGLTCPSAGTIGLMNQAVRFDGDNDFISVPVVTTSNYMVSLWLNTMCEECGIYAVQNGINTYHQLYLKKGNICSLAGSTEMCTQGGGFADGKWHYVVYSNNGSTADLWLDGIKVNVISGSGAVSSPGTTAKLGYAPSAGRPSLDGQLDDVRVFRYAQDEAVIAAIKRQAPIFLGHLDEADGSILYQDATPNDFSLGCSGETCPIGDQPGRLTNAVEFADPADVLALNQAQLSAGATAFSASMWVFPTQTRDTTQSIFTIGNAGNSQPRYAISFAPGSMFLSVQNAPNIPVGSIPLSKVELIKNTWNMITLVVERNADNTAEYYSLYVNGYLDSAWSGTTYSAGLGKITLGNSAGYSGLQSGAFTGKIDEVAVYEYALNEIDIRDMFAYQMGQVEESASITMTIDAEAPQAALISYNPDFPYVNQLDRILHVEASDSTTNISMVEMQVNHVDAPSPQWQIAPACQDAPGGTAFCPTFIPEFGEGIYTLNFRAVDEVGNQVVTPEYDFYVDNTAPKIFANLQNGTLYKAEPHPWLRKTWYLYMQGQVLDETLSQGSPGSGLDLNSIKVTIYSENGEIVGAGEQLPILTPATNGYDWELDYLFPEKEPTGALTAVITATDMVGNQTTKTINFLLDASSPNAKMENNQVQLTGLDSLLDANTMDGKLISGGEISGSVNDQPNEGIPYLTESGKAASSGVSRVEAAFESSLGVSSMYNEPYPTGLLAWLPLDSAKLPEDASGNPDENAPERYFLDISPYQFAGVCSGVNCPVSGEKGHKSGSMYFNGNEEYINLGQNVNLANRSFSAIIWARRDAVGHSDPILWQGPLSMASQRFLFGVDYNDKVVCGFGGSDLVSAEAYPDTDWHAYACTYDLDTGRRVIYRDGQEIASGQAAPVPEMYENLFIGSAPVGSFAGSLDDLVVFDRALIAEEIREQYTGYQTVYHLTVEDKFLAGGDTVMDQSGFFRRAALMTGEGDDLNKVTAGAVGNYALNFDGDDLLVVEPAFSQLLDRGSFTQSAWIRPTGGVGLRGIISEYDENPEQRYPSIYLNENYGLTAGFGNLYDWHEVTTQDNVVLPDTWNFVAARFDGTIYSLFVNGVLAVQTNELAGLIPYPSDRFNIGENFVGEIDDVKVFPRALSDLEIIAMTRSGWREAQLSDTGSGLTWSAPVLPGLEGPYRVDVRGWDNFNLFDTSWNVDHQWSGVVDTLAPRITLQRTIDPDDQFLAHYTFTIEDSYLDESSIHQNVCDQITITREYFNSSWFLATGAPPNTTLYRVSGTCSADIRTSTITGFYACDLAGNCSMKEYSSYYKFVYLPMIIGGGGSGGAFVGNLSPALPSKINEEQVERAMQWATLAGSEQKSEGGQAPVVEILTGELTPADARSYFHANIKGFVSDDSGIAAVHVEILQNGEVVYAAKAAVYEGLWNAAWTYPPGGAPANGTYTIRVTAVDDAGQQTSQEREIQVHLLP